MVKQQIKIKLMHFFSSFFVNMLILIILFFDNNYHYSLKKGFFLDIVLIGGVGFLILVALCFLTIKKIDNSSINNRNKRILNYLMLSLFVLITILIFKWYSSTC